MARYVTSAPCPLPAADAFAYMADMRHGEEWDPGIKRVVRIDGAPDGDGPGVGAAYNVTVQAGATTVMRYTITAYEPPRRVVLVARTPFLTSVDEITVTALGPGSTVTYDAKLTFNGPLALFDPLLGIAFRVIGDRAAAGLRRVLAGKVRG